MDNARELALLDRLNERIGKIREGVRKDLVSLPLRAHGTTNHNYLLGYDCGLFLALLEIADMKREIESLSSSEASSV